MKCRRNLYFAISSESCTSHGNAFFPIFKYFVDLYSVSSLCHMNNALERVYVVAELK